MQFALLVERLRNTGLWDETQEIEWLADLRDLVTELSAIGVACERTRDQYFEGECILFKDAVETLEIQTTLAQALMASVNRGRTDSGNAELSTDSDTLRKLGSERAHEKVRYIVALAKNETKTLR